jgi:hypothetical protein
LSCLQGGTHLKKKKKKGITKVMSIVDVILIM